MNEENGYAPEDLDPNKPGGSNPNDAPVGDDDDDEDEQENESMSPGMDTPMLSASEAKEIIKSKGLNIEYSGGFIYKRMSMGLSAGSIGTKEKAVGGGKKKRTLEDFRPTEEEMSLINPPNGPSAIELSADKCYTFSFTSADTKVDRGYEKFHKDALGDMAIDGVGKPFLVDHNHTTAASKGVIYHGAVINNCLRQKVMMTDTPDNQILIKNITTGVSPRVSVGFGMAMSDYKCNSCNRPMISKDCSHRPGALDENGNITIATIARVKEQYELSCVPIPMQPGAGLNKGYEEADESYDPDEDLGEPFTPAPTGPERVDTPTLSKAAGDVINTLTKELESIKNQVKSILDEKDIKVDKMLNDNEGDPIVEKIDLTDAEKAAKEAEDTAKALEAEAPKVEEKATEAPKVDSKGAVDAVTSLVTSLKSLEDAILKLRKTFKGQKKAGKESAKKLDEFLASNKSLQDTFAKSASVDMEDLRRQVVADLYEQKTDEEPGTAKRGSFAASVQSRFRAERSEK